MLAAIFISTGSAQALYRYIGADLRAAGRVNAVAASSFELVTSGSTWPYTMIVSGSTVYGGGYSSLASLQVGDEVSVVANRVSGDFTTVEVKKVPDPSTYGNAPCDSFVLSTAIFERPVNNTFYVVKDNIGTKVNYDGDTQVIGGVWDDLLPGTVVEIAGYDCRSTSTLTAQTITIVTNAALEACNSFGEGAIVVRNQAVLLAHDATSAVTPFITATIPTGTYNVYGVSFDNHSTSPWDTDSSEQWRANAYNVSTLTYSSNVTNDLPNGIDYNTTLIGSAVSINQSNRVQLAHAVTPGTMGYQSIYPICAVFVPTNQEEVIAE